MVAVRPESLSPSAPVGRAGAGGVAARDTVTWKWIIAYGAPGVGAGYMYLLLTLYVMKFSTDVLLISPAVMGVVFGISRIWDAVSDPLAGYYSDRTIAKLGRRRSWLLVSILPIAVSFVMVFSPPFALAGGALSLWMAVSIIFFYSAMTVFIVPHMSLGAELTSNYHERSRLYGMRHIAFTSGSILALLSMQVFISAQQHGPALVRDRVSTLSVVAALVTAGLIVYAIATLRERPEYQGRVNANPFQAFYDIWQNKYARLLMAVTFIENVGAAAIGVLTLYVAQYVVQRPLLGPLIILTYMVPSTLSVPLWIPLSRRFGKVRLWTWSMIVTGLAFGSSTLLPFVPVDARVVMIFIGAVFAGSAAGCGGTLGPSVQSDIIDFDELRTGERKEGAYFAAWNFVYKSSTGVMIMLTGFVLQATGFMPNQPQTFGVQLAIVALYGLFPLACYMAGAWLFRRFTLDEAEYAKIRMELDGGR